MGSEQELSKFGEITYAEKQRQKDALYVPLPVWLNEKTVSLLSDSGINLLYRHQREAQRRKAAPPGQPAECPRLIPKSQPAFIT